MWSWLLFSTCCTRDYWELIIYIRETGKNQTQFIEVKVKKIMMLPGEIGFVARLGLLSGLRARADLHKRKRSLQ
jgi:hypothetical protein